METPGFSWEQESLLLEFLAKAESWVQGFAWDLSDKSRLALHKADSHLSEMRWQLERRLLEKPEQGIAEQHQMQLGAVQRALVELRAVKPQAGDMQAALLGYDVVETKLPGTTGRRSGDRRAAIHLRVSVPDRVRVTFNREVSTPDEKRQSEGRPVWENIEWAVLQGCGPGKWDARPPRGHPYLKIIAQPQSWYLDIAPQIEGWVASYERLKSIQVFAREQHADQAGVITDNETLFRLSLESGCKSYLCKRLT